MKVPMSSNATPFMKRLRRSSLGFAAVIAMAASITVANLAPYFIGTASAAPTTNIDVSMGNTDGALNGGKPADASFDMATCNLVLDVMPLTDDNIRKYFSQLTIDDGSRGGLTFIGDKARYNTDAATIKNYNKFIDANKGKNVPVVTFAQSAQQSANASPNANCGSGGWANSRFVLLPVENFTSITDTNPAYPRTWVGFHDSQTIFQSGTNRIARTYMRFTANPNGVNGGVDTAGRLESFRTVQSNGARAFQPVSSDNFVIGGRPRSGTIVSGNTKAVRFINAATIQTTITVNGKDFTDTYVDPQWDNLPYYFLTDSTLEARKNLTYGILNVSPKANPLAAGESGNQTPFIKASGINLTYVDQKTSSKFQADLDKLGDSLTFYDYDVNGGAINASASNNAVPSGENLAGRINKTDANIWLVYSPAAKAALSVFQFGDGNEQPYAGQYTFLSQDQSATAQFVHADGGCANRGVAQFSLNAATTKVTGKWSMKSPQCATGAGFGSVNVGVTINDGAYDDALAAADTGADLNEDANAGKTTCSTTISSPLTFILCPLADTATAGVGLLDSVINNTLDINGDNYFGDNDTGNKLYGVWSDLRTVGMGGIVVGGLFIIIAQASGWEFISALILRKALPGFVIAMLLLTAWWPIGRALVQFGDVATFGVRQLIYAPFGDVGTINLNQGSGGGGTAVFAAVLGSVYVLSLGLFATATLAVSAFIATMIGAGILIIRIGIIILLQTTSSIFIPFYAIPNMKGVFNFFFGTFTKAIYIGPVFGAAIAGSRVFASILYTAAQGEPGPSRYAFIIGAILIYYGIYAFLYEIAAFVGGTFATIAGRVNDRTRGVMDRMKNVRNKAPQDRWNKFKHGELWNDGLLMNTRRGNNGFSNVSRFATRMGHRANLGAKNNFGFGVKGQAAQFYHDESQIDEELRKNAELRSLTLNDDLASTVLGNSGGTTAGARKVIKSINEGRVRAYMAENNVDEATARANAGLITEAQGEDTIRRITPQIGNRLAVLAAQRASIQNKARAVAAGDFNTYELGTDSIAEGNEYYKSSLQSSLAYFARAQGGRIDLGADPSGVKNADGTLKGMALDLENSGASTDQALAMARMLDGDQRTNVGALLAGHTASVQQAVNTAIYGLSANNVPSSVKKKSAMLMYELLMNNNPQTTAANRDIINKGVERLDLDIRGDNRETLATQLATFVSPNEDTFNGQELQNLVRNYKSDMPPGAIQPPGTPGTP